MRRRLGSTIAIVGLILGCDGYIAASGLIATANGGSVSECQARIENAEGQTYLDWQAINPRFQVGAVVPPFQHDYRLLIRCPGYETTIREITWSEGSAGQDLGHILLEKES